MMDFQYVTVIEQQQPDQVVLKRGSTIARKSLLVAQMEHEKEHTNLRKTQLNNDMIYVALHLAYLPDELFKKVNFDFSKGKDMFV